MAIIKAINSKSKITNIIKYITRKDKTESKLISGIRCTPEIAAIEMESTKLLWNKKYGRTYKHFIYSFNPDDKLDSVLAHKLALKLFENRFEGHEILIATHTDKNHLHSHIIVNSVNYENGKKLQMSKKDLEDIKNHCIDLSREYNLIEEVKKNNISTNNINKYKTIEKAIKGEYKSFVLDIAKEVLIAKQNSKSKDEFINMLLFKKITTTWTDNKKYITFKDFDGNKVRNRNLEKTFKIDFSKEGLLNEFRKNSKRRTDDERRSVDKRNGKAESFDIDRNRTERSYKDSISKRNNRYQNGEFECSKTNKGIHKETDRRINSDDGFDIFEITKSAREELSFIQETQRLARDKREAIERKRNMDSERIGTNIERNNRKNESRDYDLER